MPFISLVIPVYNGQHYLRATLDSILAQTFEEWEAVLVNDSSTDDSLQVLNEYAAQDARFRVFTVPNGGAAAKATHFGIRQMNPESRFFYYLSQDDILSPDLLQAMYERAAQTGAEVVVPDMVWYFESGEKPSTLPDFVGYHGDHDTLLDGQAAFCAANRYEVHGFALVSVDVVRRVGYFDFSYNSGDATMKLWMLAANRVAFSGGVFYYRQDNSAAITKKVSPQMFEVLQTNEWMIDYLREHYPQNAVVFGSAKKFQLDDMAGRQALLFRTRTFTPQVRKELSQRLKQAYHTYRKTGVVHLPGLKGMVYSWWINSGYWGFQCYVRWVTRHTL